MPDNGTAVYVPTQPPAHMYVPLGNQTSMHTMTLAERQQNFWLYFVYNFTNFSIGFDHKNRYSKE